MSEATQMSEATKTVEDPKQIVGADETYDEQVKVKEDLTDEENDFLEGEERVPRAAAEEPLDDVPSPTTPPNWAIIPKEIKFPPAGCSVAFIRIPTQYLRDPKLGEQQCIVWMLDEHDEDIAYKRSRGDQIRSVSELSKGTIRAINGHLADWSGENTAGNVARFWRNIGPKGRQVIRNYYIKTHALDGAEIIDFFSNHFAVVTVQKA